MDRWREGEMEGRRDGEMRNGELDRKRGGEKER